MSLMAGGRLLREGLTAGWRTAPLTCSAGVSCLAANALHAVPNIASSHTQPSSHLCAWPHQELLG